MPAFGRHGPLGETTIDGALPVSTEPPPSAASLTLRPVEDAFVRGGIYAGRNYGTSGSLHIKSNSDLDWTRHAYVKFDLGTLPSVGSAKLRLYASLSESGSVSTSVYPMTGKVWAESTVTWNSRPGYISAPLGSVAVSGTTYRWYEVDVTGYIKSEHLAGRRLVSFALHCPARSVPRINVSSREASSNRPELIVTP
jgi:hypothetical protein